MKYRTLGKNLKVSAVGMGCMGMSHAYGEPADKKEMTELLAQAVDIGYTFFDTAEIYGTPDNEHDNEELVGAALKPFRDKIVIGTKFGIRFDWTSTATNLPVMTDSRPEVIKKSVEGSLKRLQTDHIDLYYQHRQRRCHATTYRRGKNFALGTFRSRRGNNPPRPQSLSRHGDSKSLFDDGALVRKTFPRA